MQVLYPTWENHIHMGDIPDSLTLREAFLTNDLSSKLPQFNIKLVHADGEEVTAEVDPSELISDKRPGAKPSKVAAAALPDKPVKVKSWLADCGSSMHLINKRTIRK